jgi:glycosyltransferase involved in cell wall biosynthesis
MRLPVIPSNQKRDAYTEVAIRESSKIVGQSGGTLRRAIKVALFIRNFRVGGAERQAFELAKHIDKCKFEVTVISLRGGGELYGPFHSLPGVQIVTLESSFSFATLWVLIRTLQRLRIQVLHSFLTATNVYALFVKLVLPRVKVIIGLRDSITDFYMSYSSLFWRTKMWLLESCLDRLGYLGDLYLSNSEAGKLMYDAKLHVKAMVVPNGIDTERFKPDPTAGERLREVAQAPANARLVGILGNCTAYKDYPTFIHATKILVGKVEHIHFVSIGEDCSPAGTELKRLIQQLGLQNVFHFLGTRLDVEQFLPGLDVLCSSSITEGFPNALAEAMACGVPCVATDVGDSRRVLGDTGILVPAGDPPALARGVDSLLSVGSAQLQVLRDAARLRILHNFDAAAMAMRHEHVYESLVGQAFSPAEPLHTYKYSRDI